MSINRSDAYEAVLARADDWSSWFGWAMIYSMAIPVVEFLGKENKIRKIFD
jgi:hypothetical protein